MEFCEIATGSVEMPKVCGLFHAWYSGEFFAEIVGVTLPIIGRME
jgi:hypothetical protein